MASQSDLQDLLRLLTSRNKTGMLAAMGQARTLQVANLRSIEQIADASVSVIQAALGSSADAKVARGIQAACKTHVKNSAATSKSGNKRAASGPAPSSPASKRPRTNAYGSEDADPLEEKDPEVALHLPVSTDEAAMRTTILHTNRAPLLLAFATELLRCTMPGQPPSSRLSLAQAVTSANSHAKAVSLGLAGEGETGEGSSSTWASGQPRVMVMGRKVPVLKRGGYVWEKSEEEGDDNDGTLNLAESGGVLPEQHQRGGVTGSEGERAREGGWFASEEVSLKASRFIVHVTRIDRPSSRAGLMDVLTDAHPRLRTATHNAWALRITGVSGFNLTRQASFDDGESGCGQFLLRSMADAGVSDTLVVMTRWYGGVMLGPDRWRIMRRCLDDALTNMAVRPAQEVTIGRDEAVWALDEEAMKNSKHKNGSGGGDPRQPVPGAVVLLPQVARAYLLRSFGEASRDGEEGGEGTKNEKEGTKKVKIKAGKREMEAAAEENLGLLLGALRLLFRSWRGRVQSAEELDRRAWEWYVRVRPRVEGGKAGWGEKGEVRIKGILDLRAPAK